MFASKDHPNMLMEHKFLIEAVVQSIPEVLQFLMNSNWLRDDGSKLPKNVLRIS